MVKVLVVDDSPMVLEMVSAHLKQHGIEVTEANNGAEAVEKLKALTPDLVVTDVVMPQMNGYELCRWIKNNASTKNVPGYLAKASKRKEVCNAPLFSFTK